MLLAIKAYFKEKKTTATLSELCVRFGESPEAMRLMLQHWIRKGKLCHISKPSGCGTLCQRCQPELAEVYRWVENEYTV